MVSINIIGNLADKINMKCKKILILFILILISFSTQAKYGKIIDNELSTQERFQLNEFNERKKDIENLQQAKLYLIDGNTKLSRHFLSKVHLGDSKVSAIKQRYQALIYFIENDTRNAEKLMGSKYFKSNSAYKEICILKSVIEIANNNIKKAQKTYDRCVPITYEYSSNQQMWYTNIFDLAVKNRFELTGNRDGSNSFLLSSPEIARVWLKMALFTAAPGMIDAYIGTIPKDLYRSKKVREIIAYEYYRLGDEKKALSFIEDITTANSENMKGNIKLANKEYELAFGYFKVALQKKSNSRNAIERALPLAWKLEQYVDGKELLIKDTNGDYFAKKALDIAFDLKLKKHHIAMNKLRYLNKSFIENKPLKLQLMNSFINTIVDEQYYKTYYSNEACKMYDGLNCWLSFAHTIWPSINETIKREGKIIEIAEFSVENLRKKSIVNDIDEPQIINQKDIEELDSKSVIMPQETLLFWKN